MTARCDGPAKYGNGKTGVIIGRFTLALLLLQFWEDYEMDRWTGNDTMRLIKCDSARWAAGIPSFLG